MYKKNLTFIRNDGEPVLVSVESPTQEDLDETVARETARWKVENAATKPKPTPSVVQNQPAQSEPLPLPTMNVGSELGTAAPSQHTSGPLPLPTMNFEPVQPARVPLSVPSGSADATPASTENAGPLRLPTMESDKL